MRQTKRWDWLRMTWRDCNRSGSCFSNPAADWPEPQKPGGEAIPTAATLRIQRLILFLYRHSTVFCVREHLLKEVPPRTHRPGRSIGSYNQRRNDRSPHGLPQAHTISHHLGDQFR
ncbi:hypothetical protein ABZX51_012198 [Aspergillus tubingensis]